MSPRRQRASAPQNASAPDGATVTRAELLADGTGLTFRQLVHDMLAFGTRINQVRDRYAAIIGLSGTQYTILITIAHLRAEGDVGVNLVAERLHLSGAFVTIEINKLVKAGLVSKQPDLQDRRRVLLAVEEKGKELLARLRLVQRPGNDALFDSVSAEDFDMLCRVLPMLVGNAGRALRLVDYLADARPHAGESVGKARRSSSDRGSFESEIIARTPIR